MYKISFFLILLLLMITSEGPRRLEWVFDLFTENFKRLQFITIDVYNRCDIHFKR